jgi:hypothetical protein
MQIQIYRKKLKINILKKQQKQLLGEISNSVSRENYLS